MDSLMDITLLADYLMDSLIESLMDITLLADYLMDSLIDSLIDSLLTTFRMGATGPQIWCALVASILLSGTRSWEN